MVEGRNHEITGSAARTAMRNRSITKNGMTPRKMVPVDTSGRTLRSTKTLRPTGGVSRLISTTTTITMPNQT